MKQCNKCNIKKELKEFNKNIWSPDKLRHECKACNKIYYRKNTESRRQKQKDYREKNKESLRAYQEKTKQKRKDRTHTIEYKYKALKRNALKRKIIVSLSFEEYKDILLNNNQCHYCKAELPKTGYALDRKDSLIGYVKDNVVTCCTKCNMTKSSFLSYNEMLLIQEYRANSK